MTPAPAIPANIFGNVDQCISEAFHGRHESCCRAELTAALHSDDSKIQRLAFETIYRCAESDLIDSHIDRASAPSSTVPVPERIPLRGSLRSVVADGYETCGVVMSKMALIFGAADLPAHHQCQPAPDNGKLAIVLLDMQPSLRVFAAKKALFVAAVTRSVSRHGQPVSMTSPHYTTDVEAIGRQDSFAISIARASALQQQKKDDLIETASNQGIETIIPTWNLMQFPCATDICGVPPVPGPKPVP